MGAVGEIAPPPPARLARWTQRSVSGGRRGGGVVGALRSYDQALRGSPRLSAVVINAGSELLS